MKHEKRWIFMNTVKLSLLGVVCACVLATSYAETQNCQNQISMQLQQEGWVNSNTAQVTVSIQAATNKNDSSAIVANITKKLKDLIKDPISWRLIDLSTEKNSAGLFAISAKMSARLDNAQLTALQNSIDSLNKAGEQYKVEGIDYQPTLAEISNENTRLRVLIYKDVLEQQRIINGAFADSKYQLQSLNFDSSYTASPRPMMMYAGNAASATRQLTSSAATPFSQQLLVTANVTFSTPNLSCEKAEK